MGDVASPVRGREGLRPAAALIMLVMNEAPISGGTPIFDELVAVWRQAFRYEPTSDFWSEHLPGEQQPDGEVEYAAGQEPREPARPGGASRVPCLTEEMPAQRVGVKKAIENGTKPAE